MKVKIEESWRRRLQEEFDKPYFERLVAFVHEEYARAQVLPKGSQIFHISVVNLSFFGCLVVEQVFAESTSEVIGLS